MAEGIGWGMMLIGGAGLLLSIVGGGPQAGASITMIVIAAIVLYCKHRSNRENEQTIMDYYHEHYPGWSDQQIYAYRRRQQRELQQRMNKH